jgi:hypothetical protein
LSITQDHVDVDNALLDLNGNFLTDTGDNQITLKASDFDLNGNKIVDTSGGNVSIGQDILVKGDVYSSGGRDIAERYNSSQDLRKGELVSVSGPGRVVRAEEEAVGVVSTDPGIVIGGTEGYPIALEGQVPVRVEGSVEKGEYIVPAGDGMGRGCSPDELNLSDDASKSEIVDAVRSVKDDQNCLKNSIGEAMESGSGKVEVMLE